MDSASDEANEEYLVQPSLVDSLLLFDSYTLFIYKEDVCKGVVNFENPEIVTICSFSNLNLLLFRTVLH